jgi:hypothetical protein
MIQGGFMKEDGIKTEEKDKGLKNMLMETLMKECFILEKLMVMEHISGKMEKSMRGSG